MEKPQIEPKLVHNVPITEENMPAENQAEDPYRRPSSGSSEFLATLRRPVPKPEDEPVPMQESAPVQEIVPQPAPEATISAPKPAEKPAQKPKIASASFNDLMAFLDNEQKKL